MSLILKLKFVAMKSKASSHKHFLETFIMLSNFLRYTFHLILSSHSYLYLPLHDHDTIEIQVIEYQGRHSISNFFQKHCKNQLKFTFNFLTSFQNIFVKLTYTQFLFNFLKTRKEDFHQRMVLLKVHEYVVKWENFYTQFVIFYTLNCLPLNLLD